MNNWLKWLFGLEDEEVEQSTTEKTHKRANAHRHKKENLYNNQNTDAKVVYEYPKGNFRFPVIPDEIDCINTKQTMENQTTQFRSNVDQHQSISRKEFRKQQNQNTNVETSTPKTHRFKPTEVPSPVFGFAKPHKTIQTEINDEVAASVETDIQVNEAIEDSNLQIDSQTIASLPFTALSEEVTEDELKIQEEDSITSLEVEGAPHEEEKCNEEIVEFEIREEQLAIENDAAEICNQQQEDFTHPSTNEHDILENQHIDIQSDQKITQKEIIPPKHEVLENRKQPKAINWNGQVVPYNVLMLKQDKQSISQKQTQKDIQDHGIIMPSLNLLDIPPAAVDDDQEWLKEQSQLLDTAFESFNVGAKVVKATKGPSVTQFEVQPEIGVRVNKITNLTDDLKLALAARDIRIEAPIPGKSTVGIEVPNRKSRAVVIREILRSPVFQKSSSPLVVALGLDISGQPIVTDINKMPHGLIAGSTGSGKSVCINSIIISLLYKTSPHEVKLILIDPKMVELAPYNGIPHLVSPVITDVKAATAALKWAVDEMERRYELFAHEGVRDITRFNEKVQKENPKAEKMPFLVIIIDELADLMMVSPADVEEAICRIAQKARACGIHLLLATQRPSVDVITGLIKANVPTRIAFSVSSQIDSRTIIDMSGAEKLLGRGDMLFLENGSNKPVRIQGNFVNDDEIERVTQFVRQQMKPNYLFVQEELLKQAAEISSDDELFDEACQFVIEQDGASASSLQRRFRIGYNRAARLVDLMESQGIISEPKGSKPREVLVSKEQLANMQNTNLNFSGNV